MRILWLSRHVPQSAQIAELEQAFGHVEIVQQSVTLDNNPRKGAAQVLDMMRQAETPELVGVMPVAHLAALTRQGVKPIRAVMSRTPTGRTLDNGEVEYKFEHQRFERITKVEIVSEPLSLTMDEV